METMLPIQTLIRHDGAIHCLALQGDLLLSGSEDKDVKVTRPSFKDLRDVFTKGP